MDDTPAPFPGFPLPPMSLPPAAEPTTPTRQRRKRRTRAEMEAARQTAGKPKKGRKLNKKPRAHDKHVAEEAVKTYFETPLPIPPLPPYVNWTLFGRIAESLRDEPSAVAIVQALGKLFQ